MAIVRVFVPTCGRPHLLRRALNSLVAQTVSDWTAEVHNDLPDDETPLAIVAEFNDPRIKVVQHKTNLGGTATFNLFFSKVAEPYYSILEDDNWWEANFLERLLAYFESHPTITVAWANQHIAEEQADGTWLETGRTVGPRKCGEPERLIHWPQIEQLYGAIHSQGAMMIRSRADDNFQTPDVDMVAMEGFRERCFPHPLLYVTEPLGWFAVTRHTYRTNDSSKWVAIQALLAASFLKYLSKELDLRAVWSKSRSSCPSMTPLLILIAIAHKNLRHHLKFVTASDCFRLAVTSAKHPNLAWAAMNAHKKHPGLWDFLCQTTSDRFAESRMYSATL